jgi:hypothetical protein
MSVSQIEAIIHDNIAMRSGSHGEVDDENSVGGTDDYYFGHRRGRGGRYGHGGHRGGAHGRGFRPVCILMMKIFMKFLIVI